MRVLRVLLKVELVAICIFLVLAVLLAAPALTSKWQDAWLIFGYTLFIGMPLLVLLGAPAYAMARVKGVATAPLALLLGILPSAAVFILIPGLGTIAVVYGGACALLTHLVMTRWDRT